MARREHPIQDEIREAVSKDCPGVIFRCNAGAVWGGKKEWCPYNGCYIIKNPQPVRLLPPGFSDLLYFGPDKDTVFVEVKNETGKTRPDQERFLALMKKMGYRTIVARSAEDAVNFINNT